MINTNSGGGKNRDGKPACTGVIIGLTIVDAG